jgi:hypothetical protein
VRISTVMGYKDSAISFLNTETKMSDTDSAEGQRLEMRNDRREIAN